MTKNDKKIKLFLVAMQQLMIKESESMFCKKCGNEVKDGQKFCGKCGWVAEAPGSAASNNSQPAGGSKLDSFNAYRANNQQRNNEFAANNLEMLKLIALGGSVLMLITYWFSWVSAKMFGNKYTMTMWEIYENADEFTIVLWIGFLAIIASGVCTWIGKDKIALITAFCGIIPFFFYNFAYDGEVLETIIESDAYRFGLGFWLFIVGYALVAVPYGMKKKMK